MPAPPQRFTDQVSPLSFLPTILALCTDKQMADRGWQFEPKRSHEEWWIVIDNIRSLHPEQGWKIHISAGLPYADTVLERVLPVLLTRDVAFKVIALRDRLAALNRGEYGLSQIGKFITVYPNNDEEAVSLAVALDMVSMSARGGIARAIDLMTQQRRILKWARRDALMQVDGRDARDRLRWEAQVLRSLSSSRTFRASSIFLSTTLISIWSWKRFAGKHWPTMSHIFPARDGLSLSYKL